MNATRYPLRTRTIAMAGVTVAALSASVGAAGAWAAPPSNDNFADAIELSGTNTSHVGTNVEATEEVGEPIVGFDDQFGGSTIWYRWTAPITATFEVDTCGPATSSGLRTILGVYIGDAVDALVPIEQTFEPHGSSRCVGTSQTGLIFEADAGTTYAIQVGGVRFFPFDPQQGVIETSLFESTRPVNDDFRFAKALAGAVATVQQSTDGAGTEPNEPAHAGMAAAASVWFEWTAPAAADVQIDTCGSTYDTILAIYTGELLEALTPLVADDDGAACGSGASAVSFTAASGSRYWLAVDGAAGATGDLTLTFQQEASQQAAWRTIGLVHETAGDDLVLRTDIDDLGDGVRLLWWTSLNLDGEHAHVQGARVAPDGTIGPAVDLTDPAGSATGADLAVLADGTVVLLTSVITVPDEGPAVAHAEARRFTRDLDPIGGPVAISQPEFNIEGAHVLAGPDGTLTFVWSGATTHDGVATRHFVARLRRMAPDGTLGPIVDLSDHDGPGGPGNRPSVGDGPVAAVGANGTVTVVWEWKPDCCTNFGEIQAVQVPPAGAVAARVVIDADGSRPAVATAPDGSALIAWSDGTNRQPGELPPEVPLVAVRLHPDGSLGSAEPLDETGLPDDYLIREISIAMSDSGRAFVIWYRRVHVFAENLTQVRGRYVEADGTLSPLVELSVTSGGQDDAVAYPRAAWDQWGNLTASWSRLRDDGAAIQAQARRIAASGAIGPIADLNDVVAFASAVDLVVDSTGVPTSVLMHVTSASPITIAIHAAELPVADLALTAAIPAPGTAGFVVTNLGPRSSAAGTDAPIVVSFDLPAGVTVASIGGPGWSCVVTSTPVCARDAGLPVGASADPIVVELVADGSAESVPLSARVLAVSTVDPNPANDQATTAVAQPKAPALTFEPSSLAFGDIEVGDSSGAMNAMLENTGNVDITGIGFASPSNGFIADTGACGAVLPVSARCSIGVTFAPAATGPASAELHVTSSEALPVVLALTGNGVNVSEPEPTTFRYDFAEGATGYFTTELGLFNQDRDETATVEVTLLPEGGAPVVLPMALPPFGRASLDVSTVVDAATGVATVVRADRPLATTRQTSWDASVFGSTLESGAPGPSTTHSFAEGGTSLWALYYLLANGDDTDAQVTVEFVRDGLPPVTVDLVVPAQSRRTLWANAVPGMEAALAGALITSDVPIAAERAMYLTAGGTPFRAGTVSRGAHAPAPVWHFAECATSFFDCFLLLMNPDPVTDAEVEVTYRLPNGATITTHHVVPARERRTILVEAEDPALVDTTVAMTVTANVPIVAERAMWWGPTPASWYEAHAALGATEAGTVWAVGEAWAGGSALEDAFVLVANTAATPGQVQVTLVYDDGTDDTAVFALAADARLTVALSQAFPAAEGRRFSVLVESLGGDDAAPLVVEVSRYQSTGGRFGNGGGSTTATRIR